MDNRTPQERFWYEFVYGLLIFIIVMAMTRSAGMWRDYGFLKSAGIAILVAAAIRLADWGYRALKRRRR